jgi:hypothetical protein
MPRNVLVLACMQDGAGHPWRPRGDVAI